jgi:hypothetical protein
VGIARLLSLSRPLHQEVGDITHTQRLGVDQAWV